jgi:hypothetical protein
MQRTFWEWIVSMDDHIGDVMLDAGIAITLAALGTATLRLLLGWF